MKKITCTIAALLISVFAMNAQQDSDVKAAKTAKKVVVKEVRQVQKNDDHVKDAKSTKVVVKKTAEGKVIKRDDQKGDVQIKKAKATAKDADQRANKVKTKIDN